ncbi:hypothetical protein OAN38_01885 [Candidatus Marinimicrobia bacterium]|nr:hypothetical protein [Candidatus Neomarinimicrobiota bacterium]
MSSIYKKGRDGYYYYQAYVFNKDSGKKDKRIFHSLGTKDQKKALRYKKKYDDRYDRVKKVSGSFMKILKFVLFIFILVIILIFKTYFVEKTDDSVPMNTSIKNPSIKKNIDQSQQHNINGLLVKNDVPDDKFIESKSEVNVKKEKIVPEYVVRRSEILSDVFNQCKIYATVNHNLSNDQLKLVCESIKKSNHKFSSIIICLYSNNEIGINQANGTQSNLGTFKEENSWLVLYTFNPVEGEFFDSSPNGYTTNN